MDFECATLHLFFFLLLSEREKTLILHFSRLADTFIRLLPEKQQEKRGRLIPTSAGVKQSFDEGFLGEGFPRAFVKTEANANPFNGATQCSSSVHSLVDFDHLANI